MKRFFLLLLTCIFALSLCACSASEQMVTSASPVTEAPETEAETEESVQAAAPVQLQIVLGTPLTKEVSYSTDDGTSVLMTEKYELPQLQLQSEDGTVYDLDAASGTDYAQQAAICRVFNTEMQNVAAQVDATTEEKLEEARERYAGMTAEEIEYFGGYAEELTIGDTYMTSGVISIVGNGYAFYGGVHPSSYTKVWNYDLTRGEFITFDTLFGSENPNGDALKSALTDAIFSEIESENLSEGYFEDYADAVNDLSSNAVFYLRDYGMLINFDTYVLAPYAMGAQGFAIPYETFYSLLSEHIQSLLDYTPEA